MSKQIILTSTSNSFRFNINKETPFIKINKLYPENKDIFGKVTIIYKFGYINKEDNISHTLNFYEEKIILNKKEFDFDYIEFSCDIINKDVTEFSIIIDFETNNLIEIPEYLENFDQYFKEPSNVKMLFSAKFGHGKTTFLNNYFENKKEEFHIITIYPVNYSITSNEDIFKYIKCEILFQLLKVEGLEFNKQEFSIFYTIPEFLKKNVHNVLAPFINLIPGIGGDLYTVYEKLFELGKNFFDFHDKSKINDKKKAEKFISQFFENEGSLFENNFYTQLIRYLLSQIQKKGKKVVLVIEDTDRIDPEHIFRIFNVFAAHFDTYERKNECLSNKFGFDKIIIVCDIDNIYSIFKHRYGPDTDFNGYINKFFSRNPYRFNSFFVIQNIINSILPRGFGAGDMHIELLKVILNDLNESGNITIRETLKVKHFIRYKPNDDYFDKFLYHTCYYHIELLSKVINIKTLIDRFEKCSNFYSSKFNNDLIYSEKACIALLPLSLKPYVNNTVDDNTHLYYNKTRYSINILNKNLNYYQLYDAFFDPIQHKEKPTFNKINFYKILSDVGSKFIEELKF